MKVEQALSSFYKYTGFIMAGVFALAIVLGVLEHNYSIWFTQLGIILAVILPISGLILTMAILFKNRETQYGVIVIILLIVLIAAVTWRIYA